MQWSLRFLAVEPYTMGLCLNVVRLASVDRYVLILSVLVAYCKLDLSQVVWMATFMQALLISCHAMYSYMNVLSDRHVFLADPP